MAKKAAGGRGKGPRSKEDRIAAIEKKVSKADIAKAQSLKQSESGEVLTLAYLYYKVETGRGTGEFTKREREEIARARDLFGEQGAEKLAEKIRAEKAAKK